MGAWLFQGNEKGQYEFPVSDYLRSAYLKSREIQWKASNAGKDPEPVRVGDRAFIWRAEGGKPGTGGVVAVGYVIREPRQEPDEAPGLWSDPNHPGAADESVWHVQIRLEDLRLTPGEGMVRRVNLKTDPELEDLCILRRYRGVTVCAVEPRHERALDERWSSAGPELPS